MESGIYVSRDRTLYKSREHDIYLEVSFWNKEGEHGTPHSFYPSELPPIDGHYLIVHNDPHAISGGWEDVEKFVGVAHSKKELSGKVYQCALSFAKVISKTLDVPIIDRVNSKKKR